MKAWFTLVLILSLCISMNGYANNDPESNKNADKNSTSDKEVSTKELPNGANETNEPAEKRNDKADQWKLSDPDSSQYSVNKFNYLFYFIYRVKYTDLSDLIDEVSPGLQE